MAAVLVCVAFCKSQMKKNVTSVTGDISKLLYIIRVGMGIKKAIQIISEGIIIVGGLIRLHPKLQR